MIEIRVSGAVQGVGFRPSVYAAAHTLGLSGTVINSRAGVTICIDGGFADAEKLMADIRRRLPAPARIDHMEMMQRRGGGFDGFRILQSRDEGEIPTDVTPDIAICPDCLNDIRTPGRCHGYPLTNCTHCGPRFSIVRTLPYDRANTTMSRFAMCPECRREYDDPLDRRHHAQPTACNLCGPKMRMTMSDGRVIEDYDEIVAATKAELDSGRLVLSKSLGGYNIMADATAVQALHDLRQLKRRSRKPFALMAADVAAVRRIAEVSDAEKDALESWRAPIVVLRAREGALLREVAPGCATVGIMLPYMAFQHSLCGDGRLLAVTSANLPGEPIMTDDNEALDYARCHGLACVSYDRDIANRLDDSLVRIVDGRQRLMRRSRGYVPEPLHTDADCGGIMATGADITSQWAMGRSYDIIQSPYIGTLLEEGCERAYMESCRRLSALYHFAPRMVVTDMHPGYTSRRLGRDIAESTSAEVVEMQHHHAHAVSVMADLQLDGEVLALILDGTGYGTDGTIWGAELLRCTRTDFERLAYGMPLPMPGGNKASLEPWRMAASWVWSATGSLDALPRRLREHVGSEKLAIVEQMLRRHLNSPLSCGAGRLFDALAALLGIAYTNGYESEAPILLEGCAHGARTAQPYPIDADNPLDLTPMLLAILRDIGRGCSDCDIAARFHATYAQAWCRVIVKAAGQTGLRRIVMSGGVMQNALLSSRLRQSLEDAGLEVCLPERVCLGDGCIPVGQMLFGAEKLKAQKYA